MLHTVNPWIFLAFFLKLFHTKQADGASKTQEETASEMEWE